MWYSPFRRFGIICASYSWQVIFSTFGAVFLALTGFSLQNPAPNGFFCRNRPLSDVGIGVAHDLAYSSIDDKIDLIFIYLTRCAAVIYLFYQFQSLRKMGPRYVLGLLAFFVLLAISAFFLTTTSLLGLPFDSLGNFLPFFLLLVDLRKASLLALSATSSESTDELVQNLANTMEQIGPSVLLDTLVEILVFSATSLSSYGLSSVKSISCFGTVSAIANFVVFMGIFPPFLSILTEVSIKKVDDQIQADLVPKAKENRIQRKRSLAYQLSRLSFSFASQMEDELQHKTNPVLQGIKVVMGFSLVVVHVYSYLLGTSNTSFDLPAPDGSPPTTPSIAVPPAFISFLADLSDRVHLSPEQVVSIVVGLLLAIRFHFDDSDADVAAAAAVLDHKIANDVTKDINTRPSAASSSSSSTMENDDSAPTFIIGEFEECAADASTQTDTTDTEIKVNSNDRVPSFSAPSCSDASSIAPDVYSSVSVAFPPPPIHPLPASPRSEIECLGILRGSEIGASLLTDEEIITLVHRRKIPSYNLEKALGDAVRGVKIRRMVLAQKSNSTYSTSSSSSITSSPSTQLDLSKLPYEHMDYSFINGVCCENVVGYVSIPVGIVGPLNVNGLSFDVPLSTLEGALVASTNRGCKALCSSGGVTARVLDQGMTRGPLVAFKDVKEAKEASDWLKSPDALEAMRSSFSSTTRFGQLESITPQVVGRLAFLRFKARTGDAMGMNMISKGVEKCLQETLREKFPDVRVLSVSGNYCVDKKANALNWIEGRGWSVTAEATIPAAVIRDVLKTTSAAMVELNTGKNLVGSALSGAVGGFNAHAANLVTALYLATGQDVAQAGTSSSCLTFMELDGENQEDLYIAVKMPSIECGVVGGGTALPAQRSCLDLVLKGGGEGEEGADGELTQPGKRAERLAMVVAGTVMAGELSLMAALAEGQLVNSHLRLNRSSANLKKDAESK